MPDELHRPILDAGPGLNFFSINKERLLLSVLGKLSAPETVQAEVFAKARSDPRFRAAAAVWRKLTPDWIHVLSDDQSPHLDAIVRRIANQPMAHRVAHGRDLGELMVVVHAVAAAECGADVTVLIDDTQGSRMARAESNRLARRRANGGQVGTITLATTLSVLESAAGGPHIPDKATMRAIYARLRGLDDGLPPIERTSLLTGRL